MRNRLLAAAFLAGSLLTIWLAAQDRGREVERWNSVLTDPNPRFNTSPNEFLVAMTRGLKPGAALDVGMGQGRNAIFLARQGWNVTGFDPADRAVARARQLADRAGVKIVAKVQRMEDFDWGRGRFDLIVLSYVPVRGFIERIDAALKPGGIVVLEAFHSEGPVRAGGGVVWDSNELLTDFRDFRILRYEDTLGKADFGLRETRLVRLCAQRRN
jgi:SAM-dependent methyltransferase